MERRDTAPMRTLPRLSSQTTVTLDQRFLALQRRWQEAADEAGRAQLALAGLRSLLPPQDPTLIAAERRLAAARLRRHDLADEMEALEEAFDNGELAGGIWR